jgi:SAM-dependent methyltransferase
MNLNYWNNYYRGERDELKGCSSFANFILQNIDFNFNSIIDFGCGNGRDTLAFLSANKRVLACDFSQSALDSFCEHGDENLTKLNVDFGNKEPRLFYNYHNEYGAGYARFFLHAIDNKAENNFIRSARYSIRRGGKLFIECRSINGECPSNDHFRRLINKDILVDKLERSLFNVDFIEESTGFSPTHREDPLLIRIVATNNNCTRASKGCDNHQSCCVDKLRDFLFNVVDLFEQNKVHYWIDFGTSLGSRCRYLCVA